MQARPSSWTSVRLAGRSIERSMKWCRRKPGGVGCEVIITPEHLRPRLLLRGGIGRAGEQARRRPARIPATEWTMQTGMDGMGAVDDAIAAASTRYAAAEALPRTHPTRLWCQRPEQPSSRVTPDSPTRALHGLV